MNDSYTVYCHVSPSNKIYVGITGKRADLRWRKGKGYREGTKIFGAIRKYGWENFKHIFLYENCTKLFAQLMEVELISSWQTTEDTFGYNLDSGGSTNMHSDETKLKISASKIGNLYNLGNKHTDEAKSKMSSNNTRSIKVFCNGNTWPSISKCSKSIGITSSLLGLYLSGRRKLPKKYSSLGLRHA